MKVFAVSGDKKWIKLGNTFSDAQWYGTSKVSNFIDSLKKGDEVEIKSTKDSAGKNQLTYIRKSNGKASVKVPEDVKTDVEQSSYNNSDREEQIKRLSILRAVSEAVTALTGQVDVSNLGDVMEELYDRFYQKLS